MADDGGAVERAVASQLSGPSGGPLYLPREPVLHPPAVCRLIQIACCFMRQALCFGRHRAGLTGESLADDLEALEKYRGMFRELEQSALGRRTLFEGSYQRIERADSA